MILKLRTCFSANEKPKESQGGQLFADTVDHKAWGNWGNLGIFHFISRLLATMLYLLHNSKELDIEKRENREYRSLSLELADSNLDSSEFHGCINVHLCIYYLLIISAP